MIGAEESVQHAYIAEFYQRCRKCGHIQKSKWPMVWCKMNFCNGFMSGEIKQDEADGR